MKNPRHHASTARISGILVATVLAISASQSAFAADGTWTGTAGGNTWKTNGNWSGVTYPGTSGNVYTSTQIATFDATGSGTIDLGGALNIKTIYFGSGGGDAGTFVIGDANDTLNLTTAGSITVNAGVTADQTIGTAGGLINLASGTNSTASFVNNGSGTLTVASAVTTTNTNNDSYGSVLTLDGSGSGVLSGVVSNSNTTGSSGLMALTKTGSGTWTLSGANTYTGKTTVNEGTLKAGVATSAFGVTSAVTMANVSGATLDIAGFDTQIGSITGGGTTGGNVTLGANTLTVGANNTSPAAYAGAISGSGGSLTKIGSGTQILSGANTYTGTTTVKEGTLTLNRQTGSLAGTSALTMGGGTFNMSNTGAGGALSQSLGALTFTAGESTVMTTRAVAQSQALTFASVATRVTGATANFVNGGGTNSATNGFNLTGVAAGYIDQGTFYGGSAYAWMDAAGTFVRGIQYTVTPDTGTATSAGATTLASVAHQQITGAISAQNTAAFTTLNISGNNDFTLAGSQTVTVNGILKSGNLVGGAIISGGTGIQAASGAELVIRTDAINDTLTISTAILDNGSTALTKSGAGKLTLSGANTYTGATTINAGTLALGSSGALGASGNITFGGGALQFSASNSTDYSARIKNSTAAISLNTNGQAVSLGGAIDSTNTGGLTKSGGGALTISGANTYTGVTTINGGRLVLDYATNDPISTGPVTISGGALDLKGKSVGTTTETISSLTLGGTVGSVSTLTLDHNGGSGVGLTIGTFSAATSGSIINLIDLSSSSSNSIAINTLGNSVAVTNSVLMTGASFGSRAATIVVHNSDGYGFATLTNNGTLGRLTAGTELTASTANTTTNTNTNVRLTTAGTVTRTTDLNYNTLTIDSEAGDITLDMGSFNFATAQGRAILVSGANDVTIAGTGNLAGTTLFSNYSSGTFSVSLNGGASGLQFGGTGFTNYSGSIGSGVFVIGGGIVRLSKDQSLPSSSSGYYVSGGGVLEIGADLNGATAGDFDKAIGTAAGNIRITGDSGLSAAGTDRVVNFGGASAQITWGSTNFLTDVDGATDGGYTLKLSSSRSNAKLTIQNGIALGTNTHRVIDVANGGADTDAALSGVLSGTGATLVKKGAGTLSLDGVNIYSGATIISEGRLALGSTGSLASTTYSIGNGAIFDVSAQSSYSLAAVGVTIDVGSTSAGFFNGPTGALTLGNALTLNFTTSMLTDGQSYNLFDFGSQAGDFSSVTLSGSIIGSLLLTSADTWTGSFGGYDFTFSESTGALALSLSTVPEPSTWALLFGGASLFIAVCRKRHGRSRSLVK